MEFYHWLIECKKLSEATATKYDLVIKNRIIEWLPSYEIPENSIQFEAIKRLIFSLEIYQERNRVGNNMYSSALNHYGSYLKEISPYNSEMFNEDLSFTAEAEKLVKVRLLQNKFRKSLFDVHHKCIVTGYENSRFLIASHIKPWVKSGEWEKIDPYNGFLLTPNFDKLFDKGLISFDDKGKILVSYQLSESDQHFFRIPEKVSFNFHSEHKKYLEFHRDIIYKK